MRSRFDDYCAPQNVWWKEAGLDVLATVLTVCISLPVALIILMFFLLGRIYQLSEWAINRIWRRI